MRKFIVFMVLSICSVCAYVTASQNHYNISIFVPRPKYEAVPIHYNYLVPF